MAETDSGERTEEATQQRREDFRKRGQVASTKELASALAIFVSVLSFWLLGPFLFRQLHEVFTHTLSDGVTVVARTGSFLAITGFAVERLAYLTLPLMGIFLMTSVLSQVVQVGFLTNEEAFKFSADRMNPIEGFKRIFSLKSVVEGLKALVKLAVVSAVAYFVLIGEMRSLPNLFSFGVAQMLMFFGWATFKLFFGVGLLMLILAAADYFYQKFELEKQMRMTKQEIKEEFKSREGDPLIKSRVRRIQREMAQKRMMADVPKADVIITNPTHIAVALKYSKNMVAPTLIAKGADLVAQKIKDLAMENNIPIVENKPLARAIYKTMKLGQSIPRELYTAVAEVLSYVFRLKKRRWT